MTRVPDYSLRQLGYLVAVGDAGSMRAAAERCHVTEAAVSAAVRDLERILGVALVARRPGRGAALTRAGADVVADSRQLLRLAGELYEDVRAPRGSLRGQVTVGCFPTLAPRYLPPLFRLLEQEHPGSQLEVIEGGQDKLNAAALGGACDVLLTYGTGLARELQRCVLDTARPYLLLPAGHRLASRDRVELRALDGEPLILLSLDPCEANAEALLHQAGLAPGAVRRCASIETVRSMVAHGLGWTTLVQPWPAGAGVQGSPLVQRPIAPAAPCYSIVMAWTRGSARSRRLGAIIDAVRRVAAGGEECYRSQRRD
jgi:DNA-binding transcriptional LysR family regulator